jgi:hypothetical protein
MVMCVTRSPTRRRCLVLLRGLELNISKLAVLCVWLHLRPGGTTAGAETPVATAGIELISANYHLTTGQHAEKVNECSPWVMKPGLATIVAD